MNVNGGQNTLSHADSVNVTTPITNITADNVTVYVEGDYNPTYLYYPKVSELHMANNTNGALWNPTLDELSDVLRAAVMKEAEVAILYDGWIDLEYSDTVKPEGATREGEILGYDIYARLGEQYSEDYTYTNGGIYTSTDLVNYTWSITQLYRAVGVEQIEYAVQTKSDPTYNINASPLVGFLPTATKGVDLSAVISTVYATRTNPDTYLELAAIDCLGVVPSANREEQYITYGEFCLLAYKLLDLYGEPVLTEQETYLLLEAYGRDLPYGLPEVQLEAVKYLMARGIVENNLPWREKITFADATTILMRIKDEGSRLTFKDIQLTTDASLLSKGYYPTTVSTYTSPIQILDQFTGYDAYTTYDYFVEIVPSLQFTSANGNAAIPFIGADADSSEGVLAGTTYMGRVQFDGKSFYHFQVERATLDNIDVSGRVYINTAKDTDLPYRYSLPIPGSGNDGGYYTYEGSTGSTATTVSDWVWHPFSDASITIPSTYLDKSRLIAYQDTYDAQMGLFNEAVYGFSFRVHNSDLSNVSFVDRRGNAKTLADLTDASIQLPNDMSLRKLESSTYVTFEVRGCSNKETLAEIFTCKKDAAYQSYPAFAKQNNQYLVSIDYLKAIGAVWEFTQTSDTTYYLGVKEGISSSLYTDVYISDSFVIRGSQLTLYDSDTAIIVESNTGYYVDYSAILGVTSLVGFTDAEGNMTLNLSTSLDGVSTLGILNNNTLSMGGSRQEWAASVLVSDVPYIYCPITYPLANWIIVNDRVDGQQGVFTFFAQSSTSEGAEKLQSMLGVSLPDGWGVTYTPLPPLSSISVTYDSGKRVYNTADNSTPDIAYIPEYNAYLIRPTIPEDGFHLSSIVYTDKELYDWNFDADVPAPVGVPGLLGYQTSVASSLLGNVPVEVYNGTKHIAEADWNTLENGKEDTDVQYSLIHATPNAVWIQSCGFNFNFLVSSKLSSSTSTSPTLSFGDASTSFDWDSFLQNATYQSLDDWLSISILAVITILPRIFMLAFICLIGLSFIADVKPWKLFCDKVFDPYKLLTFGRRDVHTIQVKLLFLYSILALGLFGLFQNGLIIEILAWAARAVAGILSR